VRILCNNLGGFEPAAWALEAEHEVVRLRHEHILEAWACGGERWHEALLPEGWVPDVAVFWSPEYQLLPPSVWDLPCPVVLWVGDWYVDPNGLRQLAPHVDLLLCDPMGAEALRRSGVDNVAACNPWVFDPAAHQRAWDEEPLYDLAFAGSLNDVIHRERNRWLHRILRLPERWRIQVRTGVYGEEYGEILRRSRIGFNFSVAAGANMRTFEVPASGSLLMVERSNREIGDWFVPGEECVLYGPDDFEEVVTHFLEHEDERRAIAEAGWRRVREHGPDGRVPRLLEHLEAVASAPPRRARPSRVQAARAMSYHAFHMPEIGRPYGEAEVMLEDAEADAPLDAAILGNRGLLYSTFALMRDGGPASLAVDDALEYLDRAIDADPGDAVARFNRAALLHEREQHGDAAAAYDELLGLLDAGAAAVRPDRLMFRSELDDFFMVWLGASFGDPAAAPARLTPLLGGIVAQRLAAVCDDPARRVALMRRASAALGTADSLRSLAAAHVAAGDEEAALAVNAHAREAKPLFEPLWEEHVLILLALGRVAEARAVADEAAALAARLPSFAKLGERLRGRVEAARPAVRPAALDAA
jgi:tetratricopeptide (TPR) repeat protein